MVEGGITDVLIPNQIVTRDKLARLASLNRQGDVKVTVDNAENIETISEVAAENGVQIGVLIEVDTQMGRGGVRSPEPRRRAREACAGAAGSQLPRRHEPPVGRRRLAG